MRRRISSPVSHVSTTMLYLPHCSAFHLLCPSLVAAIETIASFLVLKRPPSSHPGKLATAKPIGVGVGSNSSHQVKKAEDDVLARITIHAQRNKRFEGITIQPGIFSLLAFPAIECHGHAAYRILPL